MPSIINVHPASDDRDNCVWIFAEVDGAETTYQNNNGASARLRQLDDGTFLLKRNAAGAVIHLYFKAEGEWKGGAVTTEGDEGSILGHEVDTPTTPTDGSD